MASNWPAPTASAPIDATISVPGSKSLTNRWLILAGLADEPSVLHGVLESRDSELMVAALSKLGAQFQFSGSSCRVHPINFDAAEINAEIFTGLAGTVMRFVPAIAALIPGSFTFTGDAGSYVRPMAPLFDGLRQLGVDVDFLGEPGFLPARIRVSDTVAHHSKELEVHIDASSSSQFISALLMLAAKRPCKTRIIHSGATVPSLPHIEMTCQLLGECGIETHYSHADDGNHVWEVLPGSFRVGEKTIEPDLSNAGPFLGAALLTEGRVRIKNWPDQTTQPGAAFEDLFSRMGAQVKHADGDLVLTHSGPIHALDADLSAVGELTCTIAAVAAFADGPSYLRNIGHLRGHETDRLSALTNELSRVGCKVVEYPDALEIHPVPAEDVIWRTYHDHRMATAGALVGLRVPNMIIENIETTAKTMPTFPQLWTEMLSQAGKGLDA